MDQLLTTKESQHGDEDVSYKQRAEINGAGSVNMWRRAYVDQKSGIWVREHVLTLSIRCGRARGRSRIPQIT